MTYAEQLKSPKWQKKRLEILERDGYSCQSCGDEDKQLHVHHKLYYYGRKVWEYEHKELVTICHDCHNCISEDLKKIKSHIGFIFHDVDNIHYLENILSSVVNMTPDELLKTVNFVKK